MSQNELANLLHVDQTTISTIELDKIDNPRKLPEIAASLGVPITWLRFGIVENENLSDANVQALFELQALSDEKQAVVRDLIRSLSQS